MTQPLPSLPSLARALLSALAVTLTLTTLPAQARDLNEQTIRDFVDTLESAESLEPELDALSEEVLAERQTEQPDFSRVFSDVVASMRGDPLYDDLEDIAQDHGFTDLQAWAGTGDRIFRAWMAIELEQEAPTSDQEIAQALAEIENSPHMTEAQKAQMRAMMENAMSVMESARNAPPEDVAAVRPHMDLLREFSEAE